MAEHIVYGYLQPRRDTTENWNTNNTVLKSQEMGFEVTGVNQPDNIKIGDGSTAWKDLSYSVNFTNIVSQSTLVNTYKIKVEDALNKTLAAAAAAAASEANAMRYANAAVTIAVPDTRRVVIQNLSSAYDTAVLGDELLSDSGWTLGTGWHGTFSTGFIHAAGNALELTNVLAISTGKIYQVSYTISSATAGSVVIQVGGKSTTATESGTFGPMAITTDSLSLLPTAEFNGTVKISLKEVQVSSPSILCKDSTGAESITARILDTDLHATAVGYNAGQYITTGTDNTLTGYLAGSTITTGVNNTLTGSGAGKSISTGDNNTALGAFAGTYIETGVKNTLVGSKAGYTLSRGSGNTIVGAEAGAALTYGDNNTISGFRAGASITTGNNNTLTGYMAGNALTTGAYNSLAGAFAGLNITAGNHNIITGYEAGRDITSGSYNIYTGYNAGASTLTGNNNIGTGVSALTLLTTGSYNSVIGFKAGYTLSTGANNDIHGYQAGYTLTTGSNNIVLGTNAGYNLGAATGNVIAGTNAGYDATGNDNVFVGYEAGKSATTGNSTVAVGAQAGLGLTTGAGNTLVGNSAGATVATGENNTLVGGSAGLNILDGDRNSVYGYQAGAFASGNNNTIVGYSSGKTTAAGSDIIVLSDSTVVGANAKVKANADTNEIVLGANAVGSGTNTTTIGNSDITDAYIYGVIHTNLGILRGEGCTILKTSAILTSTSFGQFIINSSSADDTITLPATTPGAALLIKNIAAYTCTVKTDSAAIVQGNDTISNVVSSVVLGSGESLQLRSSSDYWYVVSGFALATSADIDSLFN